MMTDQSDSAPIEGHVTIHPLRKSSSNPELPPSNNDMVTMATSMPKSVPFGFHGDASAIAGQPTNDDSHVVFSPPPVLPGVCVCVYMCTCVCTYE